MTYLYRFNGFVERHLLFMAPVCLAIGVLTAPWLGRFSTLVPFLFFVMAFEGSLGTNFKSIANVIAHPVQIAAVLIILHLVMPALGFAVGKIFFLSSHEIVIGIVLETVIPTAVASITWSGIYNGNISLLLSVLVVDTLLSPFLIPLSIKIILGNHVQLAVSDMILDLALVVALPAFLAMMCNWITKNRTQENWKPKLKPFSKICMIFVIILNSTKAAPYIYHLNKTRLLAALVMWGVVILGFLVSFGLAKVLQKDSSDTVSIVYAGGLRNISIGAIIAVQFFAGEAIFPVMMGTLFQQMTAGIIGKIFFQKKLKKKE